MRGFRVFLKPIVQQENTKFQASNLVGHLQTKFEQSELYHFHVFPSQVDGATIRYTFLLQSLLTEEENTIFGYESQSWAVDLCAQVGRYAETSQRDYSPDRRVVRPIVDCGIPKVKRDFSEDFFRLVAEYGDVLHVEKVYELRHPTVGFIAHFMAEGNFVETGRNRDILQERSSLICPETVTKQIWILPWRGGSRGWLESWCTR